MRIAFERIAEGSPRCGHRNCVKLFLMEHREVSVGAEGLVGHLGEGEWRRHALSSSVATAVLDGFCQDSGSYPSQVLIPVHTGSSAGQLRLRSRPLGLSTGMEKANGVLELTI